jgi:subtilisin family serine protease
VTFLLFKCLYDINEIIQENEMLISVRFAICALIIVLASSNIYGNDKLDDNVVELNGIKIINNMLIVRVKPGITAIDMGNFANKNTSISKITQMLPDSISLTHKMSNLFQFPSKNNYFEIIKAENKLLRTYIIEFSEQFEPNSFAHDFRKENSFIEISEPYYLPEFMLYMPNDAHVNNQVTALQLVKAFDAWEIEKSNPNVIIGISDSGVNQEHEDISSSISKNGGETPGDGIDNDGNGYIDDYSGYNFAWEADGTARDYTANFSNSHGQEVAGIAAATTDNNIGIAGVGFNSTLIPIKIIENNRLTHAYPSIVYAAIRGCKVLNLSWGSPKPFSDIDQSIVDFAVARDVAIVSSAGNIGSGGGTKYNTFYPAAYFGVLGVGESTINDLPDNGTVLGIQAHILAPGNLYTTQNTGYGGSGGGSSFSTPIVSGAIALARSHYPELTALQSIHFVRRCNDPIANTSHSDYLITPGRLNMAKMFSREPSDIHGIVPVNYTFKDILGDETDRFESEDIVKVSVDLRNYLGNATNVRFVLKEAYDPANAVFVTDSVITIENVDAESDFGIGDFAFMIFANYAGEVLFRLEVYADDEEPDFFKFTFTPYKTISTFENNKIEFSLSDIGEFGFETTGSTPQGSGFKIKGTGNQLYRNSTIMVSESSNRAVYNYGSAAVYDFKTIKGFINPDKHISVIDDSFAGMRQIGVEITQDVTFPHQNSDFARIGVKIKNINSVPLLDLSVGYWLDWDIGVNAEKNKTRLFPEAKPSHMPESNVAAQLAWNTEDENYIVMAAGVAAQGSNVTAQAAGLHFGITRNFDELTRISTLNSNTSMQTDTTFDISMVIAMRFDGTIMPGEERICWFCIGGGDLEGLDKKLADCLALTTSIEAGSEISSTNLYPNPAFGVLNFTIPEGKIVSSIKVFDILGIELMSTNNQIASINTSQLASGMYYITFSYTDGSIEYNKFMVSSQNR